MRKILLALIVLILVIGGVWYFGFKTPSPATSATPALVGSASYTCASGKTISASFYEGAAATSTPGQMPSPNGSAQIVLSDGRTILLPQTISADGGRYANADESVIFWSKGNGAFLMENNQQTYAGCITTKKDPGGLSQVYSNGTEGFSIRYPVGFSVDENYRYQAMGPGKEIGGIKFTIASTTAQGTNLSSDSYVSVEEIPQTSTCSASLFVDGATSTSVTENGTTYSLAVTSEAAAGNRYEESVYAIPGTNPCIAVRYLIHYGVFENYPAGSVKQFDKPALLNTFDQIRNTLTIQQ